MRHVGNLLEPMSHRHGDTGSNERGSRVEGLVAVLGEEHCAHVGPLAGLGFWKLSQNTSFRYNSTKLASS